MPVTETKESTQKAVPDHNGTTQSIFNTRYKKGGVCTDIYFTAHDLQDAIARARRYCEQRKLFHVYTHEWLTDVNRAPHDGELLP